MVTVAKRALKAGERLDGVGGFCSYGLIENRAIARAIDALPIALSEDCVLLRDIGKDEVISFSDVKLPANRLSDDLWREQCAHWPISNSVRRFNSEPGTRCRQRFIDAIGAITRFKKLRVVAGGADPWQVLS